VVVIFPYAVDANRGLLLDAPFAIKGAKDIFPLPQHPSMPRLD
jgi:hypothetical protein